MFDRQIDLIMTEFAPVAQKFLKHVIKSTVLKNDLCRLKLDLDSTQSDVTIIDAYDLVMKSVAPLEKNTRAKLPIIKERWVDFAANAGKDSGGYATDPYRVHPYVFHELDGSYGAMYMIHEIGHSGQFIFSDNSQSYFNTHMSTYYVEAPSTLMSTA